MTVARGAENLRAFPVFNAGRQVLALSFPQARPLGLPSTLAKYNRPDGTEPIRLPAG